MIRRNTFMLLRYVYAGKCVGLLLIVNFGGHYIIHDCVNNMLITTVKGIETLSKPSWLTASAIVDNNAIIAKANTLPVFMSDKYRYRQLMKAIKKALIKKAKDPVAVFVASAIR